MAPTICSEKKQQHSNHHHHHHSQHHHQQHQLRIKDLRRRVETSRNTAATTSAPMTVSSKSNALTNTTNHQHTIAATTTTTTANVGSANVAASAPVSPAALTTSAASATRITPAASASSTPRFVDFVVAKGALNSATAAAAASAVSFAWRQRRRSRCTEQLRISDNVVSSSTHMGDSVDVDESSNDNIGNNSFSYLRANGTIAPFSPDSSTRTQGASSPSLSPNESESSESYEFGDSDTTMDIDDVVHDVKRIHSSGVRSRQQTATVLKAKETKNGVGRVYHQQTNTNGLLGIAVKTIKLVQRNQLLQKRLAQLQMETSEFIASVLANPENRHFREKMNNATKAIEPKQRGNMLLRH